jgi:hypothetical protein
MGTFPTGFSILQALQVLHKTPGRIPGLGIGSDRQGCPPPPKAGGMGAVAADETMGVVTDALMNCP